MSCEICKSNFSWLRKKETKCMRCHRIICTGCSQTQQTLSNSQLQQINTCKHCQQDISYIRKTIQENMCSWNHNSNIAKTWVKDLNQARLAYKPEGDAELQNKIACEFKSLSLKQNYSLAEFFFYLWRPVQPSLIEQTVVSVVSTFVSRYPDIGFNHYLLKVAIFLLCFAKDFAVFAILETLYSKIPQWFHPKYQDSHDFYQGLERINAEAVNDFQARFRPEQAQLQLVKSFVESYAVHYKSQLLLDLTFPCCFYVMNQLVTGDEQELDKLFSALVKVNLPLLKLTRDQLEFSIMRNTFLKDLQQYQHADMKRVSMNTASTIDLRSQAFQTPSPLKPRAQNRNLTSTLNIPSTSYFDSEFEEGNTKSPSLVKVNQSEIIKLTNELMNLEMQIAQMKKENWSLEELLQQSSRQKLAILVYQDYKDLFQETIQETEQLLKLSMNQ